MPVLDLVESTRLVKKYKIRFAKSRFCKNLEEVEEACHAVGFPVAVKLVSSKLTHKTDVGGVKLNVTTIADAKKAFRQMKGRRGFSGVVVQKMLKGTEIIIGGKRDVQFGPTVLFGLGGIFVEIFQDVSIGICPLKRKDAKRMISEIKAYPILKGYRGKKGVNLREVENALLKVSRLMCREDVKELDLNPLLATEKAVVAVDARAVV